MSLAAVAAGAVLGLSWMFLFLFFVTEKPVFDRISEVLGIAFPLLMIGVVVEVHQMYAGDSPLVWVATILAMASLLATLVTNASVFFGRVPFERVAMIATSGALGTILWSGAVGWLIMAFGRLPDGLGWLGIGVVAAMVAALIPWIADRDLLLGRRAPTRVEVSIAIPVLLGAPAWLVWLGFSL